MSKLLISHKRNLIFLALLLAQIGAVEIRPKILEDNIERAKVLLREGKRKEAVQVLNQSKALARTKKDQLRLSKTLSLLLEQFLFTESFQSFASGRSFADALRWSECLKELDQVKSWDQENVLVLRLRAECSLKKETWDLAKKTYSTILSYLEGDEESLLGLAELAFIEKRYSQSLTLLESSEFKKSSSVEKRTLLKAQIYENTDRLNLAVEVLREDQEVYLDHIEVIYHLGRLYSHMASKDWLARKYLSLFISRCKRIQVDNTKSRNLKLLQPKAERLFEEIERRLNI